VPQKDKLPKSTRVIDVEHPTSWRYGYELSRETGLKAGTLYPILIRLAKFSLLETKWMTTEDGVPPRHMYRLTPNGIELARTKQISPSVVRVRRLAFSGGEA
jgi:PadR family transcriptional regulator